MCKYAVCLTQKDPRSSMILTFAEQGAARAIVDFVKGSLDPRSTAEYIGEVSTMSLTQAVAANSSDEDVKTALLVAYERALPHRLGVDVSGVRISKDGAHMTATGNVLGALRTQVGK